MRRIYTTGKKKPKKKDAGKILSHNEIHDITLSEFKFHTVNMSGPQNE